MEAVFLALIGQLNGAIFVLVCLLFLGFFGTYKIGTIVTYFKETKDKNEKVDAKIDGIKEVLNSVKATTDLLYQTHITTVQRHSPISLTARGKEIATAIEAEVKVINHWDKIKTLLEKKNPTNPYDIQTVAMDISRNCFEQIFTADEQNKIKTYAYQIGLNLLEIYPIFGVIIRDRYFKEKNIALEEIDLHDPANGTAKSS